MPRMDEVIVDKNKSFLMIHVKYTAFRKKVYVQWIDNKNFAIDKPYIYYTMA